jgi:hypothetical protein
MGSHALDIGKYPVSDERNGGHHFLRNIAVGAAIVGTLGVGGYEADRRTDWFDRLFHPAARAAAESKLTANDYEGITNEYVYRCNKANGDKEVLHPVTASRIRIEKIPKEELQVIAGEQWFKSARDFMKAFSYVGDGYAIRDGDMTYYGFTSTYTGFRIHTAGPTPLEAQKR